MALGKNLNNLLGDYFGDEQVKLSTQPEAETHTSAASPDDQSRYEQISVHTIEVGPFQTRKKFDIDKIKALAQSIAENGLVHPITVLQKTDTTTDKHFILLAGERRLRAVKLLELETIPAIIRRQSDVAEEHQAAFTAIENLHRENLNPVELAHTFEILMHAKGLTEAELATFLGKSEQYIKNYLRLLTLDGMVQKLLIDGELTEGQARFLVPLPPQQQRTLGAQIAAKKLTVKEIQTFIQSGIEQSAPKKTASPKHHSLPLDVVQKADKIAERFSNSTLKCTGDEHNGKIIISWKTKNTTRS